MPLKPIPETRNCWRCERELGDGDGFTSCRACIRELAVTANCDPERVIRAVVGKKR